MYETRKRFPQEAPTTKIAANLNAKINKKDAYNYLVRSGDLSRCLLGRAFPRCDKVRIRPNGVKLFYVFSYVLYYIILLIHLIVVYIK